MDYQDDFFTEEPVYKRQYKKSLQYHCQKSVFKIERKRSHNCWCLYCRNNSFYICRFPCCVLDKKTSKTTGKPGQWNHQQHHLRWSCCHKSEAGRQQHVHHSLIRQARKWLWTLERRNHCLTKADFWILIILTQETKGWWTLAERFEKAVTLFWSRNTKKNIIFN